MNNYSGWNTGLMKSSHRNQKRPMRAGVAAAEFAVCLPVIVLIVLATIEASTMVLIPHGRGLRRSAGRHLAQCDPHPSATERTTDTHRAASPRGYYHHDSVELGGSQRWGICGGRDLGPRHAQLRRAHHFLSWSQSHRKSHHDEGILNSALIKETKQFNPQLFTKERHVVDVAPGPCWC